VCIPRRAKTLKNKRFNLSRLGIVEHPNGNSQKSISSAKHLHFNPKRLLALEIHTKDVFIKEIRALLNKHSDKVRRDLKHEISKRLNQYGKAEDIEDILSKAFRG